MSPTAIANVIDECLNAGHFVVVPPLRLQWHPCEIETIYWELFHGRALDATMTRLTATFQSWNIEPADGANEPLLSVKWDREGQRLFVTRAVLCHTHEAVATAGNVIETREIMRWVRELVGQLDFNGLTIERLRSELMVLISQAVFGTGRLPLTSLETPLPQFLLGQLGYFPNANYQCFRRLEFELRSAQFEAGELAARSDGPNMLRELREIMLHVSLSPYTGMVANLLALLRALRAAKKITGDEHVDFLSWLLRLQWRHLNAYDLKTFHHRGANYPDALLVDEVLGEMIALIGENDSGWCDAGAIQRRAGLRLGWFLRCIYVGQAAPEQPTSPGENVRVMPNGRVPDEQLFQPQSWPRRLFDQELEITPACRRVLRAALDDLSDDAALMELGTALVLDRPLGIVKSPGEPDATPLLAHIVYSRTLALRNLERIRERIDAEWRSALESALAARINQLQVAGPTIQPLRRPPRPGVVSLDDLLQTANDFQILASTRKSVTEFIEHLELPAELTADLKQWHKILPVATADGEVLRVFNDTGQNWLTLQADFTKGFTSSHGVERPAAGFRIVT